MTKQTEKIYDSAASRPDDEFWLERGKLMITESLPSVQKATNALITGLSVIKGIYIGIIGFANFIPENIGTASLSLFFTPLLFWLISLYCCLQVVMTRKLEIVTHSPDHIKKVSAEIILEKQPSFNLVR